MTFNNKVLPRTRENSLRSANIVDLLKKVKIEESKEKRGTIIVVAAAASVITIAGLIITL